MYRTGPYFVDFAWKRFARRNSGCEASLLERGAEVLTHDDWQGPPRSIAVHHWTSTWHPAEDYKGRTSWDKARRAAFLKRKEVAESREELFDTVDTSSLKDRPIRRRRERATVSSEEVAAIKERIRRNHEERLQLDLRGVV